MSATDPFKKLSKDTEVRLHENLQKWDFRKTELASQLDQFHEERCCKTNPSLPKMALEILTDYRKKAKSCLDDMYNIVCDTQRNEVDELKVQIEGLSKQISEQQQGQMLRKDYQTLCLRQQLYVSEEMIEQLKKADSRLSPRHMAAEAKQNDAQTAIQTPGSAGKAFETAQAANRRKRRPKHARKSKSYRHSGRKARGKKRPIESLLDSLALPEKDSSLDQPQSTPTELASHIPMMPPKLPTAIRLQEEHTATPLSQELDTPPLISGDTDTSQSEYDEPEDRLTFLTGATHSLERELIAARVDVCPLMDDALLIGRELNEEYSDLLSLCEAKDSDVWNTDREEALREFGARVKQLEELVDEHEQTIEDLERNNTEHQTYCLKEARNTQSPEQSAKSGPHGTVISPEMGLWLGTALMDNTERLKSAIISCVEMENEFGGYETQQNDPNKSSAEGLINIWKPALEGHHKDFHKTLEFFREIAANILGLEHSSDPAQKAIISVPTASQFISLGKPSVLASESEYGGSTLWSGMGKSQGLSTAPTSRSSDYTIDDDDRGIDSKVNALSEPKPPVVVVVKPADSSIVGSLPMRNTASKPWVGMKARISVPGTGLMSPETTPETTPEMQEDDTESVDSPRDRNSPKKENTAETGNTPEKDSTPEKNVASKDEDDDDDDDEGDDDEGDDDEGDDDEEEEDDDDEEDDDEEEEENDSAKDMSNNSDRGSSDVPEESQAENTSTPENNDGGDDPDPTEEDTDDVESSFTLWLSSIDPLALVQWLIGTLWSFLPQVLLFLIKPIFPWIRVFAFLLKLLYYSYDRFIRSRNVDRNGKALRFPELPDDEDVYAIAYHILFLMTFHAYLDVWHERQLWYNANGQTRQLMLGKMAIQPSVISIVFSYFMGSLKFLISPFVFLGRVLSWLVWLIPNYFIQDWKASRVAQKKLWTTIERLLANR
ncbi:hypothetical protein IL306_010107 [Fusarium sp. DS 682]|nr:hypothetical protein IL306_010107 [Fusarium sp. DS 682]